MDFRRDEDTPEIGGSETDAELAAEVGPPGLDGAVRFLHHSSAGAAPDGDHAGTDRH